MTNKQRHFKVHKWLPEFLREREWNGGNGCCAECGGQRPSFYSLEDTIGHKPECKMALSLELYGEYVDWERKNDSVTKRQSDTFQEEEEARLKSEGKKE